MKHFLFCVLTFLCFNTQAQKIAIVGSSTSACTGPANPDSCYVNRILYYYNNIGFPVTVNNLAVGGTDPYYAMPTGYIPPPGRPSTNPEKNITAAISSTPQVILINFPSNGYCTYTVKEVMNCLRIMKHAAAEAGIRCFITTTQPRAESCYLLDSVQLKFTALRDSILMQFGYNGIDFYSDIANPVDSTIRLEYNSGDNIHLNNAGHRILFQKVIEKDIFGFGPVPVKFVAFSGFVKNNEAYLSWETADQESVTHFEVQRSYDGSNFTTITIAMPAGTGVSAVYNFTDLTKGAAVAYYRILSLEKNDRKNYSKIIKIAGSKQSFNISNILQSGGMIRVDIQSNEKQSITIQLINSSGQVTGSKVQWINKGNTNINVNSSSAARGLYLVNVVTSNSREVQKIYIN